MSFRKTLETLAKKASEIATQTPTKQLLKNGAKYGAIGGGCYLGARNGTSVALEEFTREWKEREKEDIASRFLKATAEATVTGTFAFLGAGISGAIGGSAIGLGAASMVRAAGLGITFFGPLKTAHTAKNAALLGLVAGEEVTNRLKK